MRNCVVHMQQVQRLGFKNFQHLGRERQSVWRMIEQGIRCDLDLVEKDVRVVQVHSDGRSVADEVDVVAAGRQLLAEFGRDNAGAAVGGVASNADAHSSAFPSCRWEANTPAPQLAARMAADDRRVLWYLTLD